MQVLSCKSEHILATMMMILLLLVLLSFSIFFLFNLLKHKNIKKSTAPLPPGPKGLPLIGNLHQFDPDRPHWYLHYLAKKYGPLMSIKLGFRRAIVISSARVAKLALKDNDLAFSGRPQLIALKKLSYNASDISVSSYNETWRELRKIGLLHLFSVKQVASFRPIRNHEVSCMIEDMIKKSNSKDDQLINLSRATFLLSIGVMCRSGFGKKYDEEGEGRFEELFKQIQEMLAGFFLGDFFPLLGWIDKLSGMDSKLEKVFRDLDMFVQQLIEDHLDTKRPESMNGDILDLLIRLKQDNQAASIGWNNIKGILIDIFVAGSDTNAAVIVWAMTAMMKAPSTMKKAQEEVRNLVGNKGSVDEDDIQNLPYLKAIIKETFRLFPPAPLSVPRETIEKCMIDGYEIPPKTLVYVSLYAIGLDPEYWENPTEFIPERFLDSTIDYKGHDFGLIPFGSGRRSCPGMNLGIAVVELALANLLYSFDWELPHGMKKEDIDMETLPGINTNKKNDLCLVGKRYVYSSNY